VGYSHILGKKKPDGLLHMPQDAVRLVSGLRRPTDGSR